MPTSTQFCQDLRCILKITVSILNTTYIFTSHSGAFVDLELIIVTVQLA